MVSPSYKTSLNNSTTLATCRVCGDKYADEPFYYSKNLQACRLIRNAQTTMHETNTDPRFSQSLQIKSLFYIFTLCCRSRNGNASLPFFTRLALYNIISFIAENGLEDEEDPFILCSIGWVAGTEYKSISESEYNQVDKNACSSLLTSNKTKKSVRRVNCTHMHRFSSNSVQYQSIPRFTTWVGGKQHGSYWPGSISNDSSNDLQEKIKGKYKYKTAGWWSKYVCPRFTKRPEGNLQAPFDKYRDSFHTELSNGLKVRIPLFKSQLHENIKPFVSNSEN